MVISEDMLCLTDQHSRHYEGTGEPPHSITCEGWLFSHFDHWVDSWTDEPCWRANFTPDRPVTTRREGFIPDRASMTIYEDFHDGMIEFYVIGNGGLDAPT